MSLQRIATQPFLHRLPILKALRMVTPVETSPRSRSPLLALILGGCAILLGFLLAPYLLPGLNPVPLPDQLAGKNDPKVGENPEPVAVSEPKPVGRQAQQPTVASPAPPKPTPAPSPTEAAPANPQAENLSPVENATKKIAIVPIEPPMGEFPVQVIRLDEGEEEFVLTKVDGHENLVLTGKVKLLIIEEVNGDAQVDAGKLQVERIVMQRGTNGRAKVKLAVPGGDVEIQGMINGESRVEIDAPGGIIRFAKSRQDRPEGGQINGVTQLRITAREIVFESDIGGASRIEVNLTKHGKLRFAKLDGGATLTIRKAAAADPNPVIEQGTVLGGAKVKIE